MNWTQAPEWAQWYTVDERGAAYWWEDEPRYSGARWWSFTGRTQRADNVTGNSAPFVVQRAEVTP